MVVAFLLIFFVLGQVPKAFAHLVSTGCGVAVLHHFFGDATWYLAVQGAAAYASLLVGGRRRGWLCTAVCVTFLLVCELAVVEPVRWHTIRAAQMLVAMRAISVGFQARLLKYIFRYFE